MSCCFQTNTAVQPAAIPESDLEKNKFALDVLTVYQGRSVSHGNLPRLDSLSLNTKKKVATASKDKFSKPAQPVAKRVSLDNLDITIQTIEAKPSPIQKTTIPDLIVINCSIGQTIVPPTFKTMLKMANALPIICDYLFGMGKANQRDYFIPYEVHSSHEERGDIIKIWFDFNYSQLQRNFREVSAWLSYFESAELSQAYINKVLNKKFFVFAATNALRGQVLILKDAIIQITRIEEIRQKANEFFPFQVTAPSGQVFDKDAFLQFLRLERESLEGVTKKELQKVSAVSLA